MIRYYVLVETPIHGQIFQAACGPENISSVLHSAVLAVDIRSSELSRAAASLKFQVDVKVAP